MRMTRPERADEGLADFLRYENVAWFDGSHVRILDRRVFPDPERFVECSTVPEVARAIADMVTQSGGPKLAALYGLRLSAAAVAGQARDEAFDAVRAHARILAAARPTTAAQLGRLLDDVIDDAVGRDTTLSVCDAVDLAVHDAVDSRYRAFGRIADRIVRAYPDPEGILTYCFGELLVGFLLQRYRAAGARPHLYVPETRPFLQGARFTATVGVQSGVQVTVISDAMTGALLASGRVGLFTTAADVIAMSGHVVNKVGTYTTAVLAHRHQVPYCVGGMPSRDHRGPEDIVIEDRDPDEVLSFRGARTTVPGVRGWYPAFDITPPELVDLVATPDFSCAPGELARHVAGAVRSA